MNIILKTCLLSCGGVTLFTGVFLGLARARGVPMHDLPVVGKLFPTPNEKGSDTPEGATTTASAGSKDPQHEPAAKNPASPSRASLIDAFTIDSPFDKSELDRIVGELKASQRQTREHLDAIATRESTLDEREHELAEKQQALEDLRAQIEAAKNGDDALKATAEQREHDAYVARGKLFEEGEADKLAQRLGSYDATEAARILATLKPERARELLDALPEAKWREYAETYSRRVASEAAAKKE